MNKVLIEGRLVEDPKTKILSNGNQMTVFSIAVNQKYKDKNGQWKERVSFIDIKCFGKLAERAGSQLNKGYKVMIEGEIRQEKRQLLSGKKRNEIKIIARKINILAKPKTAIAKTEKVAS
jgi:single-strand DNA-binding protein